MRIFLTGFSLLLLCIGTAFADQSGEERFISERATANQALNNLHAEFSGVRNYTLNGRTTKLYGRAFSFGSSPENSAEQFRLQHAAVLGALPEDLQPVSLTKDKKHIQPMMYNPVTGQYKFSLVNYCQYRDDIPVFRADLRLLVRNEPDYPLVLATSALRFLGDFQPTDKNNINFEAAQNAALSTVSGLTDFSEKEIVIWAGVNDKDAEPRMAVKFIGSSDFPERWLFVADAKTGEILYQENLIIFEDVIGTVKGYATEGTAAEQCEDEVLTAMPYARVNIGTTTAYSNDKGSFVISNFGSDTVVVESRVWGQFYRVFNNAGPDALLTQNILPPGPADFIHNPANTEYTRAEVNAYIQANIVRDIVLKFNPSYPAVSTQFEFPIYVNRSDGYCPGNAWYDPGDESLNFCASGGGYPNTAWQSVVHHEYGHHLVNMAGSGQDQYGEGLGDVMALLYSDESELGLGFYGDCVTPLRDADNSLQYPCSNEIHACAPLLSGCAWDLRNELIITHPATYLDTLRNLAINSILLHTGSLITPQITIDFLTLDDNDADLDNGTPHYSEICTAFGNHNMDCPALTLITFEYPNGRPEIVTPNQPTTIEVTIQSGAVAPVSGSGEMYYSIDGGAYQAGTMTETSANEYEITIPAIPCESRIRWYISAEAPGFGIISDPADAPDNVYQAVSANEVIVVFEDNFQTNTGWTVSGTVSDGAWNRGTPVGGGDRGDPPTDYDGSGQCYLTDNADDNSDVDDGTTILISPLIDLTDSDALVHYARWYSNNFGADPNNDEMHVYVTNDNGNNWTLVETIGPVEQANGGWFENDFMVSDFVVPTGQVKVRFDASDLGSGSVVEAAVDDFSVRTFICSSDPVIATESLPDWTEAVSYSEQLIAGGGSGVLTWSDKNSDLIGTGLMLSSSGLLSGAPSGAGTISFTALVTDESEATDEQYLSFTVNPAVAISTSSLPDGLEDSTYSEQLQSSGGTGAISWSDKFDDLSGSGLTLSSEGLLSGTTTLTGTLEFTALVEDAVGSFDEQLLSLIINPAFICGDVNVDLVVNIFDITFLITFLYQDGPPPLPMESGDVNNDSTVNIFDVTYLIGFLYGEGSTPNCP